MLKKIISLSLILFSTSCSFNEKTARYCPRALITREDGYFIQKNDKYEEFVVELTGFEGYCYFDKRIKHDKAVITPIFKIRRLSPHDETDVHFAYYTETVEGPPEYLGKKTYFARAFIPFDQKEIEYRGKEVEVRIPSEMRYEFDINLGISMSSDERGYNMKTFDVPLEYEEK